jgi:hypothetical protein
VSANVERIESRQPDVLGGYVFFGAFAVAFIALGVVGLTHGLASLGLLGFGVAALFAYGSFQATSKNVVIATANGLEWRGPKGRTYRWEEVEGLGAVRRTVGTESFLQFSVYFFDEPLRIVTDRWSQWRELAASIQRRKPTPGEQFDLEAALADAPRGEPSAALQVDPNTLKRFLEAAGLALRDLGVEMRMSERMLRAHTKHGTFELFRIAKKTLRQPESTWPAALRAHFEAVLASVKAAESFGDRFPTFESVKAHLRVRLSAPSSAMGPLVRRPLEGTPLLQVVVVAFEKHEVFVAREQLASWNVSEYDLWRAALEQTSQTPLPARTPMKESGGGAFFVGSFCATRWQEIVRSMEVKPDFGCFVALPSHEVVVVVPIEEKLDLMWLVMGGFIPAIAVALEDAPAPLSADVYWAQGGKLTLMPNVITPDGTFARVPPEALVKRLVDDGGAVGLRVEQQSGRRGGRREEA